jgi:hypothetical protein
MRINQDREAIHGRHPKAMRRRLHGGYRSAIAVMTPGGRARLGEAEGVPTDLLAIEGDLSMGMRGEGPGKQSCDGCEQDYS